MTENVSKNIDAAVGEKPEKWTGKIVGGGLGLALGGAIGYVLIGEMGVLFAGIVCGLLGAALGATFD